MTSVQNCTSFPEVFSVKHTTDIRDLPLLSSLSVENDGQVCTILYGAHLEECCVVINHNSVARCNTCCNSPDSSTFVSVFRCVVTIEERSILLLTSLVNGT